MKFCDMNQSEKLNDLETRVEQFAMLELPGQPRGMHMGTSYLVEDLWRELKKARQIIDGPE